MYRDRMDAARLQRLGKRLVELSRAVVTDAGDMPLTPGEVAVLTDAIRHPDSSVTDIHARTGFVQSHVSASVARLRERHLVQTMVDPADGRRTRVRVTDAAISAIMGRAGRQVDTAIGEAVTGAAEARRVVALLDELAELLAIDG
jgi:DNA-binding MarR family transcriptional regulator